VVQTLDGAYQPGKRAMLKITRAHGRLRRRRVQWHKNGPSTHVGSLLLGLFDAKARSIVRITSSFTWERRAALVDELAPLAKGAR
jgi:ATP-dependent DNA ligase